MLSVIIPAYNEESNIAKASEVISTILQNNNIDYELIFVDDGSSDRTWENINAENLKNSKVKGVSFSRNFGKESAILAGIAFSSGDCIASIDCDLQHPPIKLVDMYKRWESGAMVVEGMKSDRGEESAFHKYASKKFYSFMTKATGVSMENMSDFKLIDKKVAQCILAMPEDKHFFRILPAWTGYNAESLEFEVCERESGETKWNLKKLFRYALDNITSFTDLPFKFSQILLFILISAGLISSIVLKNTLMIIISALTLIAYALSTLTTSFYAARSFDELKCRPKYIIEKTIGKE